MDRKQTACMLLAVASAVVFLTGLYFLLNLDYVVRTVSATGIPYGNNVAGIAVTVIYAYIIWEFAMGCALAVGAWASFTGRLRAARVLCLIGLLSLGQMFLGSLLSLVAYFVLRKAERGVHA